MRTFPIFQPNIHGKCYCACDEGCDNEEDKHTPRAPLVGLRAGNFLEPPSVLHQFIDQAAIAIDRLERLGDRRSGDRNRAVHRRIENQRRAAQALDIAVKDRS